MTTIQTNVAYPIQQPQVIAVQQDNPHGRNIKAIRGLAITQIILGALTICFGIGAIAGFKYGYWVNASGSGIWFGIWILITGIIGVSSAKNPASNGLNGTHMAFNIVCTVISFFVGIFFVVAVVFYANCERRWNTYYHYYYYDEGFYCWGHKEAGIAIYTILLIIMITEFFVSLVASVYCCSGGCCGQTTSGVIIQQQPQHTTFVATSTTGVVNTSQYQNPPTSYPVPTSVAMYPAAGYPPQQFVSYPAQSVAYPPQSGAYPQQNLVATTSPMGMGNTNITYTTDQQNFQKVAPPPPYVE